MSTGSEPFSRVICRKASKFVVFSVVRPSLPVDVCRLKMSLPKLPNILKRRLTLTAHLRQNVGLGEGYVGSFDPVSVINQKRIQPYQFTCCNKQT